MEKKYTMKLRKVSTHSYSVTLPKEVIKKFRWKERQKLDLLIDQKSKQIKIKDWKPKRAQ